MSLDSIDQQEIQQTLFPFDAFVFSRHDHDTTPSLTLKSTWGFETQVGNFRLRGVVVSTGAAPASLGAGVVWIQAAASSGLSPVSAWWVQR